MKFKKILTGLFLLTAGITLTGFSEKPKAAYAATTRTNTSIRNTPLTKKGYVIGVQNSKKTKRDRIYVGSKNYRRALKSTTEFKARTVNPSKIRNIRFKIEKSFNPTGPRNGTIIYLIVSKNNKYSMWASPYDLKYYYWDTKTMRNVRQPLERIGNRVNSSLKNSKNKRDFNLAVKAAKKLPKYERSFVLKSLAQFKQEGNLSHMWKNILLFDL